MPAPEPDVSILRAAQQALSAGSLTALRCLALAEAVDTMVSTVGKKWLLDPDDRGVPISMLFEVADELWTRSTKLPSLPARAVLAGAMASMVGEVIAAARAEENPASPLLIGASGAVARFRQWCRPDEQGQARMLVAASYGLASAASRITAELCETELDQAVVRTRVAAITTSLTQMLATVEQLTDDYDPDVWWCDDVVAVEGAGEASTLVRSLCGVAWIGDVLAYEADALPAALIMAIKRQLEAMWPHVSQRPLDAAAVLSGLSHCASAWSSAVARGQARGCEPALTALWYARQLWGSHGEQPYVMTAVCAAIRATVAGAASILGSRDDTSSMRGSLVAARLFEQVSGRAALVEDDALAGLCDVATFCAVAAELQAVGASQAVRHAVVAMASVWTAQADPRRALGGAIQAAVDLSEAVCDVLVAGGEDLTSEAAVLLEQLEALSTLVQEEDIASARVFAERIHHAANTLLHACETLAARGGAPPKMMWWRAACLAQWAHGQLAVAPRLAALHSVDLG